MKEVDVLEENKAIPGQKIDDKEELVSDVDHWDITIEPSNSVLSFGLAELWRYRDLLVMFIKRDIVTVYKQTILGPIWFVVQPILTSITYLVIFGKLAGISTDGVPPILFYLAGTTIWNFFADGFNSTSNTFKENQDIFGKVYFPRLIMPISKIASGLIKFAIQFCLFMLVYFYYLFITDGIAPNYTVVLIPVYLLLMAGISLGAGIIFTSLTNKYRDLTFLIQFGVQLLMYATPVIYPVSSIPEKYQFYMMLNPITSIIEGFKYSLLGVGSFDMFYLLYSVVFTIILLLVGIIIFNKTEKTFMDTV
jgi:lipopolysaccharide transport system permease protein